MFDYSSALRDSHKCCPLPTRPTKQGGPRRRGTLHLPLTRQSATYAGEGIELDVSTLADWVGASAATLMPLVEVIRDHMFAAERIHADDTTVPVLDTGRTRIGRLWVYVRDDRPFAGADPPARRTSTHQTAAAPIPKNI
jgi:hypothetical protein